MHRVIEAEPHSWPPDDLALVACALIAAAKNADPEPSCESRTQKGIRRALALAVCFRYVWRQAESENVIVYVIQCYRLEPGDVGVPDVPVGDDLQEAKTTAERRLLSAFSDSSMLSHLRPHHVRIVDRDGHVVHAGMALPNSLWNGPQLRRETTPRTQKAI